jgi:hypothetical protein
MVRTDNGGGQAGLAFTHGVELLVRAEDAAAAKDMLGIEGFESGSDELPDAEDSENS